MKFWRELLRIAGLVFPVLYFYISKEDLLTLIFIFGMFFVLLDGSRLISKRLNNFIFRKFDYIFNKNEERNLSKFSWYMISCFIIILSFSKEIAVIALCFVTIGDIISKLAGEVYGKTFLLKNKTLEEGFGFFMTCLFIGSVLRLVLPEMSFWIILFGSLSVAIVEVLPIPIDDSLTASVISAAVMTYMAGVV